MLIIAYYSKFQAFELDTRQIYIYIYILYIYIYSDDNEMKILIINKAIKISEQFDEVKMVYLLH